MDKGIPMFLACLCNLFRQGLCNLCNVCNVCNHDYAGGVQCFPPST